MLFFLGFGLLALALALVSYSQLGIRTDWPAYINWLISINAAAFVMYVVDNTLAVFYGDDSDPIRVPNNLHHALALLGGFFGALAGMLLLGHKVSARNVKNKPFIPIIAISGVVHLILLNQMLIGG